MIPAITPAKLLTIMQSTNNTGHSNRNDVRNKARKYIPTKIPTNDAQNITDDDAINNLRAIPALILATIVHKYTRKG